MKAMAGIGVPSHLPTVVTGPDGVVRCRWARATGRDLTAYHDDEWGRPTHDEAELFEALVLTYFENGLSWASVFGPRGNLRAAFHGFDPAAVAAMTDGDVERLMADSSIIRNRQKIEATLHNARLLSKYPLCQLAWQHQPFTQHRLRSWSDGRMVSPESRRLSAAVREAGFRLVGRSSPIHSCKPSGSRTVTSRAVFAPRHEVL
ncbi:DNA-3-methyladenine glycosylase I [Mycobacterium paraffinicum]|uniref:DNA-3-methyladenine glycosylase I n=1 Tax=Mycobacterium paraffinicum TaxID=53378 RepID=A0ABP8RA67_9MYCO|nr:DNA-3-methyladenine glycosylase I [Mycobacterium paraffinicum]MCV7311455.1 DNA-3-methyladenine glycosylase I [Mycobacterium paraffinicum]